MARRSQEGPVKSPVNIAVGALLKRLRESSGRGLDQAAPVLDVSPAYLNAIEAGTNALPASSVAGLNSLGVSFLPASALLTMVSYLDCRIRNSRVYDLAEILVRAEALLSAQDVAAFHPFLEWLVASIQARNAVSTHIAHGTDSLESGLARLALLKPAGDNADHTALPAGDTSLSPMIGDMLDMVSSGLSLVTPHISRFKFKAWEELNAGRMYEVRAYVDDAERFLEDAPDFDWHAILLNAHHPKLTVIVPGATALSEQELTEEFYKRLPLFNRSQTQLQGVKRQIRFVKAKHTSESGINRALVYDFSHGQLVQESSWATLGAGIVDQKRYNQFNNAWLYELRPYGSRAATVKNTIVILGAYNDVELSSFGVFLNHADCGTWWKLTENIIK
jgi:hypothetical protein